MLRWSEVLLGVGGREVREGVGRNGLVDYSGLSDGYDMFELLLIVSNGGMLYQGVKVMFCWILDCQDLCRSADWKYPRFEVLYQTTNRECLGENIVAVTQCPW